MLAELYPRVHARYECLRLLGPFIDGYIDWLQSKGYPRLPVCHRVRTAKRIDRLLWRRGVRQLDELTATAFLAYAPKDSQDDIPLAAGIRSLARYLGERAAFLPARSTPGQNLLASYRALLKDLRGLSPKTVGQHDATAAEFLGHVGCTGDLDQLRVLDQHAIEGFIVAKGERLSRESLQHTVAQTRSFLRFLAAKGLAPEGLDRRIDTARVYRGERLPRALSWETVLAFLETIDRSTPMGRRDYAMFLLMATYGLRSCEVVSLTLDDIAWRTGQLSVPRRKVRSPLLLPLTPQVGAAIFAYLRDGRPGLAHREVFLRARAPAGTLKATAPGEAFQRRVRHSGLPIPFEGPHCLRHSLALHLLRRGVSLKVIGDLLGHRSAESTCVYLRLHIEDLREVALDLPADVRR